MTEEKRVTEQAAIDRARRKIPECFGESTESGEGKFSASKPKVWKVESDGEDSDFECYNKSDGTPVYVDIDKVVTEEGPALAILPNISEEIERKNNGDTMGGNGNISVCKSNRLLKPTERLGSAPCF